MSFTYSYTDEPIIARVRLTIGDTVEGSGVLPDDKNFSDEEIQAVLTEVNNSIDATAYIFLRSLSNAWGHFADITIGPRKEALGGIGFHYAKRAEELGNQTGLSGKSFAVLLTRVDGYSEAAGDQ